MQKSKSISKHKNKNLQKEIDNGFIDSVFKLYGMPTLIVSDKGPIFLSAFWKELFKLQGSKLCMSYGYHT